jgi:hypothetical protein
VQAMVLNALGFSSRALYLMPDYLPNKPVDILIGQGLKAEDFTDDSLGRSLETLYAKGIAASVCRRAVPRSRTLWPNSNKPKHQSSFKALCAPLKCELGCCKKNQPQNQ